MKERRYDMDWLRVIAMMVVFFFHSARFFCTEEWHLKVPAAEQSDILWTLRDVFVGVWNMELFFLVAGFATWYSLRHRTAGRYLVERVKRLLVPLYTVGLLVLLVPQAYFDGVTKGYLAGTFWQLLPSYYVTLPGNLLRSWRPLVDPAFLLPYPFSGHLWFIQTLFVISLVTLPLLLYLRSERGGRTIDRLAGWVVRPGGAFLFVVPLALVQIALRWQPEAPERGWAAFLWYALFYVFGYVIAADGRFTDGIKRHGWLYLVLWIGVLVVMGGTLQFVFDYDLSPNQGFSALYVIYVVGWSFVSWCAVAFMLSLGAKYLTSGNRFLTYSNEAVLPFYLFHQTIILIVGWFVLRLSIGNWLRYLIIAGLSFPLILILYEVFVRRVGFMRFLFGMAPKKEQPVTPAQRPRRRRLLAFGMQRE